MADLTAAEEAFAWRLHCDRQGCGQQAAHRGWWAEPDATLTELHLHGPAAESSSPLDRLVELVKWVVDDAEGRHPVRPAGFPADSVVRAVDP